MKFIRNVERHYEKIDFAVHCVSATEAQIGDFANAFYLENIKNIQQEFDVKGRNCLVFKITEQKSIRMPVLRAAKIIWIYYCIKYMKEEQNLHGYIFSDWFAGDARIGEDPALGVAMVNFLLSKTSIDLSLSIANEPGARDDDLLSDWFAGWSNSSKGDTPHSELSTRFDALINRKPKKVDWVMTQAVITVDINSS